MTGKSDIAPQTSIRVFQHQRLVTWHLRY